LERILLYDPSEQSESTGYLLKVIGVFYHPVYLII